MAEYPIPGTSPYDCPNICPTRPPPKKKVYIDPNVSKIQPMHEAAKPYVPGLITPREPKVYPPNAPPSYLPQPTDTSSGDFLTMGPIDPWAPGHMDWSPQAGSTGVRPVVDKYSITRYSTGQWRARNHFMTSALTTERGKQLIEKNHREIYKAFKDIKREHEVTSDKLGERIKDLSYWKKQVEKAQKRISDELETLEVYRMRLKGASSILMMPEAISRECLELRTHRLEPDLVRDDAEQELVREVAIVGEIRKIFNDTLVKVEKQLLENKAAKAAIELDWGDKMIALRGDRHNLAMTPKSTLLMWHAGVNRWTENSTSLEYWEHFCSENIKNTDEVRERSEELRQNINTILEKGGQDMKNQCDRTNVALAQVIIDTEAVCLKLEEALKDNLQKIADVEKLLEYLRDSLRDLAERDKLAMTRLQFRNYERPRVENCKDEAQYALMDEIKFVKDKTEEFKDRVRQANVVRAELMKFRGDLEKEIAVKRKSLNIDRDRLSRVRAHMPSPEEFAGGGVTE